ncbi:MAG: ATP-binding protein, partial [Bacillota bacterium]|nr:ATP-binding protein [Bacillota bacterium]
MNKKHRNKAILNLLGFIVIIIIGILVLLMTNIMLNKAYREFDTELENSSNRALIGEYIIRYLEDLETDVYSISINKNNEYAKLLRSEMEVKIDNLLNAIMVLDKGGYIDYNLSLNLVDKLDYTEKIFYEVKTVSDFAIETINLKPKIMGVIDLVDQLIDHISNYRVAVKNNDIEESQIILKEMQEFVKTIPSYFGRTRENASRILYESRVAIAEKRKEINKLKKYYIGISRGIILLVLFIFLYFAYYFSRKMIENSERLSKLAREAKQAGKARMEFISNMSHEIRTPLNTMIGYTDILYEDEIDSKKIEKLDIIKSSSEHLLMIINDILDFSKIDNNKMKLDNVIFNLEDETSKVFKMFILKAKEKDIEYEYINEKRTNYLVKGDYHKLNQVIINLLSNAFKFIVNGSIILTVDYKREESMLYFSVKDTGVGIAHNKLEKILNPFEQSDSSVTRKHGGTGLGLAISKSLIEIMGGEFTIHSNVGIGTEIFIKVPLEFIEEKINTEINGEKMVEKWLYADDDFTELVREAINVLPDYLKDIEKSVEIESIDKILKASHKLKGMTGNFQMTELYKVCCDIVEETRVEEPSINKIVKYVELLRYYIELIPERFYTNNYFDNNVVNIEKINLKVLIADDVKMNRMLLKEILERENISSKEASNGLEVLEML